MRFSLNAALTVGFLAPALETIRRWDTWRRNPPALFDDYLIGALLLSAVWISRRNPVRGRVVLAAGWGFTCAMAYVSVFAQIADIDAGIPDPAPIPSGWVLFVKLAGATLAAVSLVLTVRGYPPTPEDAGNRG